MTEALKVYQPHADTDEKEARRVAVRTQLREVRHAHMRTEVLCARAERYRELAMRATGRADAIRLGGTSQNSKVETYVLELIDVHADLQKEISQLMRLSREMEKRIAVLESDSQRAVLQLRYLCAYDWQDIANRLHFSLSWVHRLHREAIEILAEEG